MSDVVHDKFHGLSSEVCSNTNSCELKNNIIMVPIASVIISLVLLYLINPPFLFIKPFEYSLPRVSVVRVLVSCLISGVASVLLMFFFSRKE